MRTIAGTPRASISFLSRHSRTEFILRVHDEYLRVSKTDPERAKLLNIRYTGLQAYSIIEGYERMKAGMRLYRHVFDQDSRPFSNISSLYRQISQAFPHFRMPNGSRRCSPPTSRFIWDGSAIM